MNHFSLNSFEFYLFTWAAYIVQPYSPDNRLVAGESLYPYVLEDYLGKHFLRVWSQMMKIQVTFCPVTGQLLHGFPSSWQLCLLPLRSLSPPHPQPPALLLGSPYSATPPSSPHPQFLRPRLQPPPPHVPLDSISTSITYQRRTRPGDLKLFSIFSLWSGSHSLTLQLMALHQFLCKTPLKSSGCSSRYLTFIGDQ